MEPENASRMSVAPAITNQVLTSWLLTTSPRSSASSRRFWVGSSDRSVSSPSSDTWLYRNAVSVMWGKLAQHAFDGIEERAHHRADNEQQDQEAGQDRDRQADKEDLHLRHQPRQDAEAEIEQEPEHHERRRELNADAEGGRDRARGQLGDVAAPRNLAGPERR